MKAVLEILEATEKFLTAKGFPCARSDAQWLLAHVLGLNRLDLYVQFDRPLTDAELEAMRHCLRRRAAGEPVQYIVGTVAFFNVDLEVGTGVLIPRPETERLVELALAAYPGEGPVLDLCTGSGAVALALAAELSPAPPMVGVDLSAEALVWAERNRQRLHAEQVRFVQGDLFGPLAGQRFVLMTANPPYVTSAEYDLLPRDVHDHEPRLALEAGTDGLGVIRRIAAEGQAYLSAGGRLVMEIGELQGAAVAELLHSAGWQDVTIRHDHSDRERIAMARKG